jgi:hypothetical protein
MRMLQLFCFVIVCVVADTVVDDDFPALPSSPSNNHGEDEEQQRLVVGGDAVELGPVVVNADGTLSRIKGYSRMTPHERARILAVVQERNRKRLDARRDSEQV